MFCTTFPGQCRPFPAPDVAPAAAAAASWTHTVPHQVPWARDPSTGHPLGSHELQDVIHFTAMLPPASSSPFHVGHVSSPVIPRSPHFIPNGQIKRGNWSDDEDEDSLEPPCKISATADKVAAKLEHLNLGSRCPAPLASPTPAADDETEMADSYRDSGPSFEPLVHFSEEMTAVMSCDASGILTDIIKKEQDKSSKALVLWTPNPLACVIEAEDSSDEEDCLPSNCGDGPIIEEILDGPDCMDLDV